MTVAATGGLVVAALVTGPGAGAGDGTFTQTGAITVPALGAASPYPSTITVSGLPSGITDVNVTLTSVDHTLPDNVDVVLVGPDETQVVLMSDVGGTTPVAGLNLVLDDEADAELDNTAELFSGTFRPNNITQGDALPLPAPDTTLADDVLWAFDETDPNGVWSLYVADDTAGDSGDFSGGWSLQIETVDLPEPPTLDQPVAGSSTDNDGDLIFAGSAEDDTVVDVYEGTELQGSAEVVDGAWAVAVVGVGSGSHTYTATATDALDNVSEDSDEVSVRVDVTAPRVIRVRPARAAHRVRPGADLTATFREAMRPVTMNRANVALVKDGTAQTVAARVTYSRSSHQVTINPRHDLAAGTRYQVVISTRARDVAGNRLDQKAGTVGSQRLVWRFMTR